MNREQGWINELSHFVHKQFLYLLVGSYAVAACYPAAGLWLKDVSLGEIAVFGTRSKISLSMLMLAWLLLTTGLGVPISRIRQMLRSPRLLIAGLAANLLIPITFIVVVTNAMRGWHNADEVQNILSDWRWSPRCQLPGPPRPGPRIPTATDPEPRTRRLLHHAQPDHDTAGSAFGSG